MQSFSEQLDFTNVRLLNYFSYRITAKNESYAVFNKVGEKDSFYAFQEADKEVLSIFGTSKAQLYDKESLFFFLTGFVQLQETEGLIRAIKASTPVDKSPSFEKSAHLSEILSIAFSLGPLPEKAEHKWANLPIFANRIFFSKQSKLTAPLCMYSDRKFIGFVNAVYWKGQARTYLNDRTNGIYSSKLTDLATYALVTSSPYSWEIVAQREAMEDYFFILAHDHATQDTFDGIINLCTKEKLKGVSFPISSDVSELNFVLNYLTYLFAESEYDFLPVFTGHPTFIELRVDVATTQVGELVSFISQFEHKANELFQDGVGGSYVLNSNLKKDFFLTISKKRKESSVLFSIRLPIQPQLTQIFLTQFVSLFYKKNNLTINFLLLD